MVETKKKVYDVLPPKMILKIRDLFDKLTPEDVNVDFIAKFKESRDEAYSNIADFEKLGGQYLYAQDVCINNAKVCEAFHQEGMVRLKAEEALAKLDRAITKYGSQDEKTGKMKITDGKAESYVSIDEEVRRLSTLVNGWAILRGFFLDYQRLFDKKHEWIKTMLFIETKSSNNQS